MEQYSCVHLFIVLLMNTTLMTITLQTIPRCACVHLRILAEGGWGRGGIATVSLHSAGCSKTH